MSLKKRIMAKDPRLSIISNEVIRDVPCIESVILCGSRAIIQGGKPLSMLSDYDVIVVMKTLLIPFYLRRIKMVENKLSKEFGVKVNLNPLPMFRIRRAKGNLFLFKLKREGITLYGKDYIKALNPGDVKDIGRDWYFFYIFYSMKELIKSFDPSFMFTELNDGQRKWLIHNSVKALFQCSELSLLMKRRYEIRPKNRVNESTGLKFNKDLPLTLIEKNRMRLDEPLRFWFQVRDTLLETFQTLMWNFMNAHGYDLNDLATEYLKRNRNRLLFKNVQYIILTAILKKQFLISVLFSHYLIADRIFSALVELLLSIKENGNIDQETLDIAYRILKDYMDVHYFEDSIVLWKHLRNIVCTYWSYACTALGV